MAFLGGTFFPVERLPEWVQKILLVLPLTHASGAIRAAALGESLHQWGFVAMALIGALFFLLAWVP